MNSGSHTATPHAPRLWRNRDFLKLWSGSSISEFGSLVTVIAMPFAAILALEATPLQIAMLRSSEIVPALVLAPVAGVWVDRLRRRPILIATDVGRAVLLATIPAAAAAHVLGIAQLYAVTFLAAILGIFFDVAYRSYLPSIVAREELIGANAKLSATASVAEIGAFSLSGWLVQVLTAPIAILIDAISFLFSALFVAAIKAPEPMPTTPAEQSGLPREVSEGARFVLGNPTLRALAVTAAVGTFSSSLFGTEYSLYALRELGFRPAILGVIYAVGGVSSLCGALLVGRVSARLGSGRAMVLGLVVWGLGELCLPLARGATTLAAALMVVQQLTDGGAVIFYVNKTTVQQTIPPSAMLGRVNATMRFVSLGCQLLGSLAAGVLAELIGLRPTLAIGAAGDLVAAALLMFSPVRTLNDAAASASESVEAQVVIAK